MRASGVLSLGDRCRAAIGVALLLVALDLAVAACSGDDDDRGRSAEPGSPPVDTDEPTGTSDAAAIGDDCEVRGRLSSEPATTSVRVTLTEYAIAARPQQVPAGPVELVVANDGRIWHELIVVRFDGDPGSLAQDRFGGADETQLAEQAQVGKILEFLAGTTCRVTLELAPGNYALICNLVDDGSNPHYGQGMYTGLTVT